MKTFSIKESFRKSWELWKQNKGLMTIAAIFSMVVASFKNGGQDSHHYRTPFVIAVAFFLLAVLMKIGLTKLFLKVNDGQHTNWKEVFKHGDLFFVYLATTILFGLGVIVGSLLLIIPGIYFLFTYMFAPVIVIDQKIGIIDAFKKSAQMTDGVKWKIFGLMLLLALTNIVGVLVFVVGLLVSIPVSALVYMHVYRKLSL